MKLSVKRENLLKPLQVANSVVERRQSSPVLSNLLLTINGQSLSMTGTDLEVEMITNAQLDSGENGEITLPARKFLDICRTLPEGSVIEMIIDGERATIRSGRSRYTLSILPAAEFPNMDTLETPFEFSVSQKQLKELIEKTQFCMAVQDVRYYLNGLLLELSGGSLTAVATDGHRLAFSRINLETPVSDDKQVIVPRKGIVELAKLLEDKDDPVTIQLGTNHIRLKLGDVVFTSKLIDGKFPDYNQVIPSNTDKVVESDRNRLLQAFTRASVLSNEKYRGMRLTLEPNLLRATLHNPEQEEAEEELEVNYEGSEFEIGFNVSYFIDALHAIRGNDAQIHFTDSNHSCLIQDKQDDSSRYVIMPMRL